MIPLSLRLQKKMKKLPEILVMQSETKRNSIPQGLCGPRLKHKAIPVAVHI
jgi:hypothetical protein